MSSDLHDLLLLSEVAEHYGVSVRTVERWVEQGVPAQKATEEQLLRLLAAKRLKGWPPKGVWLIHSEHLNQIEQIRRPVGYPKGKPRKAGAESVEGQ
jgi:hypothetical protein